VGRLFRLGEMRVRNLVACGTAAGISAVFNAPITGVMFSLEIILRDYGVRALSTVVTASVAASIISRIFLGESPAFSVPYFNLRSPWEIFLYLGLGILSAFVGVAFIWIFDKCETFFEKLKLTPWIKPAVGGLIVGAIGFYFPQVFGMGFKVIEHTFSGTLDLKLLLILLILKMLTTSVSLGSGGSGGTFAPTLMVGAVLGGALGKIIYGHVPFLTGLPGAYALAGMASVFAAAFHAPVTAIFLVFEMTRDYQMILPIMITSVVATSIAQLLNRESMDTMKLQKSGLNLQHLEEVRVLGALQVRDAMSNAFELISNSLSVKEVMDHMAHDKDKSFFLINEKGDTVGWIKREEIQAALVEENMQAILATDIASPLSEYCFTDEPLSESAKLMLEHNVTQIPVMDPLQPAHVVGVLKSEDIFRAYTDLTSRRSDIRNRLESESSSQANVVTVRFIVTASSDVAGKMIKDIDLPRELILTAIKKGKVEIVPHGDSVLKTMDKVWAVISREHEAEFIHWVKNHHLRLF
jgi:CIC family chloride channel protein